MTDVQLWRDLRECSDTELIVQRTNLAKYFKLGFVRARLIEIQRELDSRQTAAKHPTVSGDA
jgi:hypothetical protein